MKKRTRGIEPSSEKGGELCLFQSKQKVSVRSITMVFMFTLAPLLALAATEPIDCQSSSNLDENTRDIASVAEGIEPCHDRRKIGGICNFISSMSRDNNPNSSYVYLYEKNIYEASCVDIDNDTDEEISRKVNALWNAYEDELVCYNTSFDVKNGSVLKFAVAIRFQDFIEDAAFLWKINLNKIDPSDNRTVLDYVEQRIDLSRGNANEPILRRYYEILRQSGAKHRRELQE
jgi:hypothetical protein